jgi:hypothetical protein
VTKLEAIQKRWANPAPFNNRAREDIQMLLLWNAKLKSALQTIASQSDMAIEKEGIWAKRVAETALNI